MSYDSHTNNVMAVGFQRDGKWMYSGSEDGTVKICPSSSIGVISVSCMIIVLNANRAPGCQREYESRAAVNTVVLHPNQFSYKIWLFSSIEGLKAALPKTVTTCSPKCLRDGHFSNSQRMEQNIQTTQPKRYHPLHQETP